MNTVIFSLIGIIVGFITFVFLPGINSRIGLNPLFAFLLSLVLCLCVVWFIIPLTENITMQKIFKISIGIVLLLISHYLISSSKPESILFALLISCFSLMYKIGACALFGFIVTNCVKLFFE